MILTQGGNKGMCSGMLSRNLNAELRDMYADYKQYK
jgi:hypothetical protein